MDNIENNNNKKDISFEITRLESNVSLLIEEFSKICYDAPSNHQTLVSAIGQIDSVINDLKMKNRK